MKHSELRRKLPLLIFIFASETNFLNDNELIKLFMWYENIQGTFFIIIKLIRFKQLNRPHDFFTSKLILYLYT